MLERAKEVTRNGKHTNIEYARFADDLVILVDAHPRHDWLLQAVERRLREELAALNPFFLEESVRTLVETKLLVGERGAYRAAKTPAPLEQVRQIPATTQALLAARIDRLLPEHKRLLQAASVIGTDVLFVLIQAIVDEPEGHCGKDSPNSRPPNTCTKCASFRNWSTRSSMR